MPRTFDQPSLFGNDKPADAAALVTVAADRTPLNAAQKKFNDLTAKIRHERDRVETLTALMARAEQWSRDHGAVEIASDTWIDHELSIEAHRALGFDIVERTVHFRKALTSAQTEPTAATPGDSSVQH